ncbi:MAG: bifunctional 4-hydroxy-2-oxoglutarate aldolase/2-dehydro-3-deoxy-phosphogluconate aldolase [Christensenellales bacterium]|jgi:2-dehydro-3-deoxyphosphogluconate aldolase/(4S)-4-hydroxy-2-oxoglutarate aldolase
MDTVMARVRKEKIIAIVRGLEREYMLPLASALVAGGITLIEVTFDQSSPASWQDTQAAIRALNTEFGGKVIAGAGTVMTIGQVNLAHEAGARYVVSPTVEAVVIRETKRLGMASFPGALTPTECVLANRAGADAVKLFPASTLSPAYLKAIRAPLSDIDFLAVGGVDEKNAADFIAAGAIGVGIGGSLVNRAWIERGEFDKITALARQCRKAVG